VLTFEKRVTGAFRYVSEGLLEGSAYLVVAILEKKAFDFVDFQWKIFTSNQFSGYEGRFGKWSLKILCYAKILIKCLSWHQWFTRSRNHL
jgi:hypothetical protein